jgi:hypothetical protein
MLSNDSMGKKLPHSCNDRIRDDLGNSILPGGDYELTL